MQLQENGSLQQNSDAENSNAQSIIKKKFSPQPNVADSVEAQRVLARSQKHDSSGVTLLLDLLKFIAPLTISIALLWLSYQQDNRATDNQKQQAMSDYFEQMTELTLKEKDFGEKFEENEQAQFIARAKTLSTLRQLDGKRKGQVLKFLYEAKLVRKCETSEVVTHLNVQLGECKKSILDLSDVKLDETTFDLGKIALDGIDLEGASLNNAQLPNIGLVGAEMKGVKLNNANLKGAILQEAKMPDAYLISAKLTDAILVETILTSASLDRADLRGAILRGADLHSAEIREGKLDNAILEGANLTNANLKGASLQGANLQKANLTGANLEGASLQGANLQGAIYNDQTNFGDFNPEGRGMIPQP